jgi:hypothetical protein
VLHLSLLRNQKKFSQEIPVKQQLINVSHGTSQVEAEVGHEIDVVLENQSSVQTTRHDLFVIRKLSMEFKGKELTQNLRLSMCCND